MNQRSLYITGIVLLLAAGCTQVLPGEPTASKSSRSTTRPDIASLSTELRQSVTHLAGTIGERNCWHPDKLALAADWIELQFKQMGYATRRVAVLVPGDPYLCKAQVVYNIEATKPGRENANEILVIGAHYDSKVAMKHWDADGPPLAHLPGTPGADDNASGVAGVLAVARMLRDVPLSRTIKFVAFVNEEPPFFQSDAMGSLVYARRLKAECIRNDSPQPQKIVSMISFEMLGYFEKSDQKKRPFGIGTLGLTEDVDYIAFLGNWANKEFGRQCGKIFHAHAPMTVRVARLPILWQSIAWSDDWAFWEIGVPAVACTDTLFLRNDHYHDVSDKPDTLNYDKMAEVVRGLRYLVTELAR